MGFSILQVAKASISLDKELEHRSQIVFTSALSSKIQVPGRVNPNLVLNDHLVLSVF